MPPRRRRKKNTAALRLKRLTISLVMVLAISLLVAMNLPQGNSDLPILNHTNPTNPSTTAPSTAPSQTTEPSTEPPLTGWVELNGQKYYYGDDSVLRTGAQEVDGSIYCFGTDGALLGEGWQDIDNDRYYVTASGTAYLGWLELENERYYLQTDGTMARGQVEIDGQNWFFTSAGCQFFLVNPWHYVPEGYAPNLIAVSSSISREDTKVDASCYEALMQMMADCKKAGHKVYILSSYRTHEYQTYLFDRQVKKQMAKGYSREDAEVIAATISAIPGTSEHQLGLAVDIIDTQLWDLVEEQEDLAGQQWLMAHCHEYGFILRYPKDKTDETGIIYEPWHYRYVGKALAQELHDLGMTLETYVASLS